MGRRPYRSVPWCGGRLTTLESRRFQLGSADMSLLTDKVAVITGAGRGIGRACATLFVEHGAWVVINDVEEGPAKEAVAACDAIAKGRATYHVGSVADPKATDGLMRTAVERFHRLDVLVN